MKSDLPPDWPLWLTPDLQARYRDATAELWDSIGNRRDFFNRALRVAIGEAERARQHNWPERKVAERGAAVERGWQTANNAARRLADHLELLDGFVTWQRLTYAAKKSGVTFKGGSGRAPNVALAAFLRALAAQKLHKVPTKPGQLRHVGPFIVSCGARATDPDSATMLTVDLAFLFRELSAGRTTINNGTEVVGGDCWDAAASFANAAFDQDDAAAIKAAAMKWKRGKRVQWRGWRAK